MRGTIAAVTMATACLCAPAVAHAQEFNDPLESTNRHMFSIHESIDRNVLSPVAHAYRAITTRPIRRGVNNFLHNLRSPVIFVNDVLQGEVGRAGTTAARFGVNSTVGILGVFDPADHMGLQPHEEDFGQTLAVWGVKSGPYIFVPVVGPTNVRDGFGEIVDIALDPFNWLEFQGDSAFRGTRLVLSGIAARENLIEEVDALHRDSVDPYVTIRTSYGLLRHSAIQNGRQDVQTLPEFEEIPESDAPPPGAPEGPPQTEPTTPPQERPGQTTSGVLP